MNGQREMTTAEVQSLQRLQSMRHNFRLLRPIFKAAPKSEWEDMKLAYRFGPNYYLFKGLAQAASQSTQPDKIGV